MMYDSLGAKTIFTRPDAVEAWDGLFRWRERDGLRDRTVDDTWQRVADAVAPSEGAAADGWAEKYTQAFRRWQWLPDERLLRAAGTGQGSFPLPDPSVAVNAAAFIALSPFAPARFLRQQLVDSAALAVRFLDDALLASPNGTACTALRIGFIGVANAMAAIDARANSSAASLFAEELCQALCEGCLRGSVELAMERGARTQVDAEFASRWRRRGIPMALIEGAELHGLRYGDLTAMLPHPLLARLANGVADGIDWSPGGFEAAARQQLRLAMQPYFDQPIPG